MNVQRCLMACCLVAAQSVPSKNPAHDIGLVGGKAVFQKLQIGHMQMTMAEYGLIWTKPPKR